MGSNFIHPSADLRNITAMGFLKPYLDLYEESDYTAYKESNEKLNEVTQIQKAKLEKYTFENIQKKCAEIKLRNENKMKELEEKYSLNKIFIRPEFRWPSSNCIKEIYFYYEPGREGCKHIIYSLFGGKDIVNSFQRIGPSFPMRLIKNLKGPVIRKLDEISREIFIIKHNKEEYSILFDENNYGNWILYSKVIPKSNDNILSYNGIEDNILLTNKGIVDYRRFFHLMNVIDDLFQCRKKAYEALFSKCKGSKNAFLPTVIVNLIMEYFG